MNRSEDWDAIWRWRWFLRPTWQPYFRDPTHPEGRTARQTPIWGWILHELGAHSVLDSNAGLGLRAILLSEAGFDVTGVDSSTVAVTHAAELAASRDVSVPFRRAAWEDLGRMFPERFDAALNDTLALSVSRDDLVNAAQGLYAALKPGGALIFMGADEWSRPEARAGLVEQAWQAAPRFQLRSDFEHAGTHLSFLVARDRGEYGVIENYLFVVREADSTTGARLETASICNSVQWTWDDYQTVMCGEAGFSSLKSVKVPSGRREHILNVARK